jgi:hypothetical protein
MEGISLTIFKMGDLFAIVINVNERVLDLVGHYLLYWVKLGGLAID